MAYVLGNAKPKTTELTHKNMRIKILITSGKGNTNSGTGAGTGSLTVILLAY